MGGFPYLLEDIAQIEGKIGYHFHDAALLAQAFIHRSYVNENRSALGHNERLEFLGDSILGMLIADHLYRRLPDTAEGDLSLLRSRLVEAGSCGAYIAKLDIAHFLLLGKGEQLNKGRGRETILADLFEAIIGAIYLDGGMEAARGFIFKNFSTEIDQLIEAPWQNWKALLQDWCQKRYQQAPVYSVICQSGPDHSKLFTVAVAVYDHELGRGSGASKKEAQQAAAAAALTYLQAEKNG